MADELDVLLEKVDSPTLRADLRTQIGRLRSKRAFGLVYENHIPERVRLPNHAVRRGVSVVKRVAPVDEPHEVLRVLDGKATLTTSEGTEEVVDVDDLVVIARFGDPIYPGLQRVGDLSLGGDRPAHLVLNAENYHALDLLQFTHAGKVDCIYIDPPYNTGARDWKYDNDYVDADDAYRHSKWLAFMERRLSLAKNLLNPEQSVLIVSIDEKEVHRLGLLLEQLFPSARVQSVSSLINPAVVARAGAFGRSDEHIFFVMIGAAAPQRVRLSREWVSAKGRTHTGNVRWDLLRRSGPNAARSDRPALFYPIYIDPSGPSIAEVGEPIAPGDHSAPEFGDAVALLPIRKDGSEGNWQAQPSTLRTRIEQGRVRVTGSVTKGFTISVLKTGEYDKISRGEYQVIGRRADKSLIVADSETDDVLATPPTQWRISSHDATQYGSRLLSSFVPGRVFPFPKSLYAVEDALRFFVTDKPNAIILDFFAGSGTTTHAVARLNRQDGGRRQSITVTNNEVSADEARGLAAEGLRQGDAAWEELGVFHHITKPRVEAAMTGQDWHGDPLKGSYRFGQEFPFAEGLHENVAFFTLTYLDPLEVELDASFESVAPLLWMRAGSEGPMLTSGLDGRGEVVPFAISARYGVLFDPDSWRAFVRELPSSVGVVFVVTDSPATFAGIVAALPGDLEVVRLYENYLQTFAINRGA